MTRSTCRACGRTFVGVGAFDDHRVGKFDLTQPGYGRRCAAPEGPPGEALVDDQTEAPAGVAVDGCAAPTAPREAMPRTAWDGVV
jgi:hypothetical protein